MESTKVMFQITNQFTIHRFHMSHVDKITVVPIGCGSKDVPRSSRECCCSVSINKGTSR